MDSNLRNNDDYLTPFLKKKIKEMEYRKKMNDSLFWGAVNTSGLVFIVYDLTYNRKVYGTLPHNCEVLLAGLLLVNTVFHITRLIWLKVKTIELEGVNVSPQLSVPTDEKFEFSCFQRSSLEVILAEEHSDNSNLIDGNLSKSAGNTLNTPILKKGSITSEKSLTRYLKEYEETENNPINVLTLDSNSSFNQFWCDTPLTTMEVSPIFRRTVYQTSLSPSDFGKKQGEDDGLPILQVNSELWRRHHIKPIQLINWISNLRMWISRSILQRIVDEISIIDNGLKSQGLVGFSVGKVGVDTLSTTAINTSVAHSIPTLASLIPFLQISPNQHYVVQRIKELAVGSSMSDYKWKSGGKLDEKEWDTHLPTDAELVMHLVSTYLDSQLPLLRSAPDARPFTMQYFSKFPNKPKQTELTIFQQRANPPYYQLIVKDEVQDIPQGRNNLFFALLLFLHHIYIHHDGMLGRINLGQSGLNMLWIIENSKSPEYKRVSQDSEMKKYI